MSQKVFAADLEGFDEVYRRHVGYVVSQDMEGVLADMAPGAVPEVFAGVVTPRHRVDSTDVRRTSVDDSGRAFGECVYVTKDSVIGLRSGWFHDGTIWRADTLENFEP